MAKQLEINPFTERHYPQLKQLQKRLKATLEYLTKCKNCKFDVDEEIKATKEQLDSIAGILREFFPQKPE